MPVYTPALDLILNRADKTASGLLTLLGPRVVASPSSASAAAHRIIAGDQGNCRLRVCEPNLTGERAFDDVDLSLATVRISLGVPGTAPYCLATIATPFPTAAGYVTTRQSVTADLPATKRITLDPPPFGGSLIVTLDARAPFEIPFDAEAAEIKALAGPAYKIRKRGSNVWEISGMEPNQDVTIALDVSNLIVPAGVTGRLILNTNELAAAFVAAGTAKWFKLTLEVEAQFPGETLPRKLYQGEVQVARALLDLSSLVPAPIPLSDYATLSGLIAGKQPINSALTAISSLLTTSWGRSLLTLSDAGALRTFASVQPLSGQLTSIAALSTASYGRGLLTQPDAATLRSYIGNSFANLSAKPTTIDGYGISDFNSLGDARWLLQSDHTFTGLIGKPTTIVGYGITDFNSLGDVRWVQLAGLNALGDARWSLLGHTHTFSSLTSKPTTITGFGITDFNSLGDARWPLLSGSYTNPSWLVSIPFSKLTSTPVTLAGYGIGDAVTAAALTALNLRTILSADRTYYVRADGNDSNDGLSNGAGGSFATIQAAVNSALGRVDTNGHNVTINIVGVAGASTTYAAGANIQGPLTGGGYLRLQGINGSGFLDPTAVTINVAAGNCFDVGHSASVYIQGFTFLAAAGSALSVATNATVVQGTNRFGACGNMHIDAGTGANVLNLYDYEIVGGALGHWHADGPSSIVSGPITVTLTGTPVFVAYFVGVSQGRVLCGGMTFTGAASGVRYVAHKNGTIDASGAGANYLPGSIAGSAGSGGVYAGTDYGMPPVGGRLPYSWTVPLGAQNSVTIPLPGNFTDAVIRITGRTERNSENEQIDLRLNGDSGANYAWAQQGRIFGVAPTTPASISATLIPVGNLATVNSGNHGGGIVINLPGYSQSSWHKAILSQSTEFLLATGGLVTPTADSTYTGGSWNSTAPVTDLTILTDSGANFSTGISITVTVF